MHKGLAGILLAGLVVLAMPVGAKPLRIVGDNNYPPYLFLGPDGKPRGYVVDLWRLWERKTGIPVELTATNWDDAQRRLRQGQADVIEMIFRTPGREQSFDFGPPWTSVTVGVYVDAAIKGIDGPNALKGFEVGVERGDACAERMRRDGIHTVREFTSYTGMIEAANRRDIRIFCMDEYPAEYYLYRLGEDRQFSKAFDYYTAQFRRGVRKGDGITLALVRRGMALITPEERSALERKWMGQRVDFTPYTRILGYALAGGTLAGIALLAWIWALRSAVSRRTRDLDFLANHDALTGLPNRRLLLDRLEHAMAQNGGGQLAVLSVDLDNFKRINESRGHPVGDQLLKATVERLQRNAPAAATIARVGGDEFVVVLAEHAAPMAVSALAAALLQAMQRPFVVDGQELFVGASIGVSLFPSDGTEGTVLLRNADAALSRAKQAGRNRCVFYSAALTEQTDRLLQLDVRLRRALEEEEFQLAFQPLVQVGTGTITGVEALLRWRTAQGVIAPGEFIPFAEESGLIEPIGHWVLGTACRQLAQWLDSGLPPVHMAINLSPRQLASPLLVEQVQEALATSRVPPQLLELEITEGALLEHGAAATGILRALRVLGVRLAIDDFGTGYSSLAYLRHFPVDVLKIDRSFLRGVPSDRGAVEVVSAIVAMAHGLRLKVVAEGVEDADQWAFLKRIGCDFSQGWYHGRPMPAPEAAALMRASARALSTGTP